MGGNPAKKAPRPWLPCGGISLIIFAAAVISWRANAFAPDGGIFYGLLFYFFLQPVSAFVCGAVLSAKNAAAWFVWPIIAGACEALAQSLAMGGSLNDFGGFFLFSFLPALVGCLAGLGIRAVRRGLPRRKARQGEPFPRP